MVVEADEAVELVARARAQVEVVDQKRREWEDAKADATAAKGAYESAQAALTSMLREEEAPPLPLLDQPAEDWRSVGIDTLGLKPRIVAALTEAELTTIGALSDWTAGGKRLVDVKGVGEAAAQEIDDATEAYWATHKAPAETPADGSAPIPEFTENRDEPPTGVPPFSRVATAARAEGAAKAGEYSLWIGAAGSRLVGPDESRLLDILTAHGVSGPLSVEKPGVAVASLDEAAAVILADLASNAAEWREQHQAAVETPMAKARQRKAPRAAKRRAKEAVSPAYVKPTADEVLALLPPWAADPDRVEQLQEADQRGEQACDDWTMATELRIAGHVHRDAHAQCDLRDAEAIKRWRDRQAAAAPEPADPQWQDWAEFDARLDSGDLVTVIWHGMAHDGSHAELRGAAISATGYYSLHPRGLDIEAETLRQWAERVVREKAAERQAEQAKADRKKGGKSKAKGTATGVTA